MKLPNVASLVAFCLVLIPAVQVAIQQVFPAADWYWSPLIVTLLGTVAKILQEQRQTTPPAPPPEGVSFSPTPAQPTPSTARRVLLG